MPRLEFSHVSVSYTDTQNDALHAVRDFSLMVNPGEAVAFIGPSGCGKSTLLRAACGLFAPSAGQVLVDGEALTKPRQSTALILQDFGLLPWKSVYANAELGLKVAGVAAAERKERTMAALQAVELAEFAHAWPSQLSGGMKQRLAIARALAQDADVLLMDEPLSALDALLREQLQDTLLKVWLERRPTQILVTHSIEEAIYLGQRIVVLTPRPGRIFAVVNNPHVGEAGWRASEDFFAQCTRVRALLDEAIAAGGEDAPGEINATGEDTPGKMTAAGEGASGATSPTPESEVSR